MMKTSLRAGLCALALSAALPASAQTGGELVISCFRGPWKQIIWDRPNTSFIDSLVARGYDIATANSIGTRVCRDPAGVDNPDAMRRLTIQLLRETPVRR